MHLEAWVYKYCYWMADLRKHLYDNSLYWKLFVLYYFYKIAKYSYYSKTKFPMKLIYVF